MTEQPRVKGFTYDVDLSEDFFREIEIIFQDDAPSFKFERVKFNRDRVFEFYSAWKNFDESKSDNYFDRLTLSDHAYVLFEIVDGFDGKITFVLEKEFPLKVEVPIFFMEFESFIYEMLEDDLAYEFSE